MAANISNAALAFPGSYFPAIPGKKQNRSEQHSEQNIAVGRLVRYVRQAELMFRVLLELVHFGAALIKYAPGVFRHHKWMCGVSGFSRGFSAIHASTATRSSDRIRLT